MCERGNDFNWACQIFATTKLVSATNKKVCLNSNTLEIHSALLLLNCFAVFRFTATYYTSETRFFEIVAIVLVIIEFLAQLLICYICVKLGANDSLKRFDCCMVDGGKGGYQIKL